MELRKGSVESSCEEVCPAVLALRVMLGSWRLVTLDELLIRMRLFSDLSGALAGVSARVHPEVPTRAEYRISLKGKALIPLLKSLHGWLADGLQAGRPIPEASHR